MPAHLGRREFCSRNGRNDSRDSHVPFNRFERLPILRSAWL